MQNGRDIERETHTEINRESERGRRTERQREKERSSIKKEFV